MRLIVLTLAVIVGLSGQPLRLAANYDGDRVLVVTPQFGYAEQSLYESDGAKLLLLSQAPKRIPCAMTSAVWLDIPSYVGRANAYSYHERGVCWGIRGQVAYTQYSFRTENVPTIAGDVGSLQWSAGGKYAGIAKADGQLWVVERESGMSTELSSAGGVRRSFASRMAIADNGDAVVKYEPIALDGSIVGRPQLWRNGTFSDLGPTLAYDCALDPLARYAICGLTDRVVVIDLENKEERLLASGRSLGIFLSADGQRAVIRTLEETTVFAMPDGIPTQKVFLKKYQHYGWLSLSGNGRYIFTYTENGRHDSIVTRYDIETGEELDWASPKVP